MKYKTMQSSEKTAVRTEVSRRNKLKNRFAAGDHTFAVCAYKESPYLEECLASLMRQTVSSNRIVVTSTDNDYIRKMAEKYGLPCYSNPVRGKGIAEDWNYAVSQASTPLVTIAHQDDIYFEGYCESILNYANRARHPLILFTDYAEKRENDIVLSNRLLHVKRFMLSPLKIRFLWEKRFVRRRILSLGSPICCPSVTYVKENLRLPIFETGYRSDLDWQAWEKISRRKGGFVYIDHVLMAHRIHEESETSAMIADDRRKREDYEMFCKFWPGWIAGLLEHFYQKGEKSNELQG